MIINDLDTHVWAQYDGSESKLTSLQYLIAFEDDDHPGVYTDQSINGVMQDKTLRYDSYQDDRHVIVKYCQRSLLRYIKQSSINHQHYCQNIIILTTRQDQDSLAFKNNIASLWHNIASPSSTIPADQQRYQTVRHTHDWWYLIRI